MKIQNQHDWSIKTEEAREIQKKLASEVLRLNTHLAPRLIGGIDVSVSPFTKEGRAAAILLNYPSLDLVDSATAEGEINFPYVPGLLSFREVPLVIKACCKLAYKPDSFS